MSKNKIPPVVVGIGAAVVAGLIVNQLTKQNGSSSSGFWGSSAPVPTPYGNSPRGTMVAFRPSQPRPQTKITTYPKPIHKRKTPYDWGYTTGADGGALI